VALPTVVFTPASALALQHPGALAISAELFGHCRRRRQTARPQSPNVGVQGGAREAGLPPIRFHDVRRTVATLLLTKGVHPKVVSEMLGQATITLTLDTYSHLVPSMHAQAATVMDDLLSA
jgi:integrase